MNLNQELLFVYDLSESQQETINGGISTGPIAVRNGSIRASAFSGPDGESSSVVTTGERISPAEFDAAFARATAKYRVNPKYASFFS
jgi:hypothetical protein